MEALKLPKTQTGTVLKTSELPWGSLTLIEPYRGFIWSALYGQQLCASHK